MELPVEFPGGVRVRTTVRGFTVDTDQPAPLGENTAPPPFDLFLASLATCAGFYALRFCQERQIDTTGMSLRLTTEKNPDGKGLAKIGLALTTPPGFPEKYRDAIRRAMDQCAVKKLIHDPPEFAVEVNLGASQLSST